MLVHNVYSWIVSKSPFHEILSSVVLGLSLVWSLYLAGVGIHSLVRMGCAM